MERPTERRLIVGIHIPCWLARFVPPGTLNFLLRVGLAVFAMQRVERRGTVESWRKHFWKVAKSHAIGGYVAGDLLDLIRVFREVDCG